MNHTTAPILDEAFSLARESLQAVGRMPKTYRFSLGSKISERSMQLLFNVCEASAKSDANSKIELLQKIKTDVSILTLCWRLTQQLGGVSNGLHAIINLHLAEIYNQGNALELWAKKSKDKIS